MNSIDTARSQRVCVLSTVNETRLLKIERNMVHRICAFLVFNGFCMLSMSDGLASTEVPGAEQKRPIALVNATIHPVSSAAIEVGTILMEDGRIAALGTDLQLPEGTEKIDARGKHIYPGMINAGGQLGLTEVNSVRATLDHSETGMLNPNARAEVAVNPDSELIPVTRANGVLLSLSVPTGGLMSGTSALMALDGWTWQDMTLKAPVGLHIQWPRMRPVQAWWVEHSASEQNEERDEQLKSLHDAFDLAVDYRRAKEAGDPRDPTVDARWQSLLPVLAGDVPIIAHANSSSQIQSAVAFAAARSLKLIIYGGYDAPYCARLLKEHDVPVIIGSVYRLPRRRADAFDDAYTLPARLHKAGVPFCIAGVDRFGATNLRNLPYHAATAVAYGLPEDEAIKSLTLYPARILGVDSRVGSLEVGKDATLIVTSGNPLETPSQVERAFIQGRVVDLNSRHTRLWKKYQVKYRRIQEAEEDR